MKIEPRDREDYFADYDCEREIRAFTKWVMEQEGFGDWEVIFAGEHKDGICIQKMKQIRIGHHWLAGVRVVDSKYFVLHEIAHINTLEQDGWHGDNYNNELIRLIARYIVSPKLFRDVCDCFGEYQLKQTVCRSYIGRCYCCPETQRLCKKELERSKK